MSTLDVDQQVIIKLKRKKKQTFMTFALVFTAVPELLAELGREARSNILRDRKRN